MTGGIRQATTVVVPGDHDVAELIDRRVGKERRRRFDQATRPCQAVIGGAGNADIAIVLVEAVVGIGGDDVNMPRPCRVRQDPRLRAANREERCPRDGTGIACRLQIKRDVGPAGHFGDGADGVREIVVETDDDDLAIMIGNVVSTVALL